MVVIKLRINTKNLDEKELSLERFIRPSNLSDSYFLYNCRK